MREVHIHIRIDKTTAIFGAVAAMLSLLAYRALSASVETTVTYPSPAGVYRQIIITNSASLARDGGTVAIGTTSPSTARLGVMGSVAIGALSAGTAALAVLGGNVGIGTTAPTAALEVVGAIKPSEGLILSPLGADPSGPVAGQIWMR